MEKNIHLLRGKLSAATLCFWKFRGRACKPRETKTVME